MRVFKKTVLVLAACLLFSPIHFYTTAAEAWDIMSPNPFNQKFRPPKQQEQDEKKDEKKTGIQNESYDLPDVVQEIKDFREFVKSDEFSALQERVQEQLRESLGEEYLQNLQNTTRTIPQAQNNPETKEETLPPIPEKPEEKPGSRDQQEEYLSSHPFTHTVSVGMVKLFLIVLSITSFFLLMVRKRGGTDFNCR